MKRFIALSLGFVAAGVSPSIAAANESDHYIVIDGECYYAAGGTLIKTPCPREVNGE